MLGEGQLCLLHHFAWEDSHPFFLVSCKVGWYWSWVGFYQFAPSTNSPIDAVGSQLAATSSYYESTFLWSRQLSCSQLPPFCVWTLAALAGPVHVLVVSYLGHFRPCLFTSGFLSPLPVIHITANAEVGTCLSFPRLNVGYLSWWHQFEKHHQIWVNDFIFHQIWFRLEINSWRFFPNILNILKPQFDFDFTLCLFSTLSWSQDIASTCKLWINELFLQSWLGKFMVSTPFAKMEKGWN